MREVWWEIKFEMGVIVYILKVINFDFQGDFSTWRLTVYKEVRSEEYSFFRNSIQFRGSKAIEIFFGFDYISFPTFAHSCLVVLLKRLKTRRAKVQSIFRKAATFIHRFAISKNELPRENFWENHIFTDDSEFLQILPVSSHVWMVVKFPEYNRVERACQE